MKKGDMILMDENYWNEIYWGKRLKERNDMDFVNDIWLNKYNEIIDKIPKGKALDLGCGIGQFSIYLKSKGFKVIASDISSEALKTLKSITKEIEIVQLDMSKPLNYSDNSFDLVFANLSIHYFDEQTTIKLMKEIARVLKPNGYFIGSVNSLKGYDDIKRQAKEIEPNYYFSGTRNFRLWDFKQFKQIFTDFEIIKLKELNINRWEKNKYVWEFISIKK